MSEQRDWRFCGGCHGLFWDGDPNKAVCPAGGGHVALGNNFNLKFLSPDGTPNIMLRYTGMICFGETTYDGGSGEDEIYCISNVATIENGQPVVRTEHHPVGIGVYENVNAGGAWPGPLAACYSGPAQAMSVVVTMMEHDSGDPDKYREEIRGAARAAAAAASASGYPVPDWAAVIVADIINAALGTGDDNLGTASFTLDKDELLGLADSPRQNEQGVDYRKFTMHNGEGSTYKAYFDVVRA